MIILVRHGEATHHTEHFTGGWTDSELTERGKQQMQDLAEVLVKEFAGHPVPAIFLVTCNEPMLQRILLA